MGPLGALDRLPYEVRDLILDHLFAPTQFDYPGAQKAELRIYSGHVILRRISPIPPPRFKGCRALMKACKAMHHHVLEYMYSRLDFNVLICGSTRDPGPRFSRLNSEYPVGTTAACMPLRYTRSIRLVLRAWEAEDVERLKIRLRTFLETIEQSAALKFHFIGFYSPLPGSLNHIALMLEQKLHSRVPTEIYSEGDFVSSERIQLLREAINSNKSRIAPAHNT